MHENDGAWNQNVCRESSLITVAADKVLVMALSSLPAGRTASRHLPDIMSDKQTKLQDVSVVEFN